MIGIGASIDAVLDQALSGKTSTLHLFGPRGSGKSWWLDETESGARQRGFRITRAQGDTHDRELPFGALAALLSPFRDHLVDPTWAVLRPIVALDFQAADPTEIKLTAFRLLCALAEERPICLLLDDLHWYDAASVEVLAFAARRADADAIAFLSTSTNETSAVSATAVRLDPIPVAKVREMLVAIGIDEVAATRCAEAADGNPGIARALAAGLTDAQRSGIAPVSVIPRPTGELVNELQASLRAYGEATCRSLVVAAAEHGGNTSAVRAALIALGEPPEGLDDAESLGLVEIVGARFAFTDPWVRSVAYHLVAPTSRRAAHRALAASFSQPEQAAERAWHLAASADGPNKAASEALELVAADAARRGALTSAALTAERAAEFCSAPRDRQRNLLAATRWWIDSASADHVRRLLKLLEPIDCDTAVAMAEARQFLDGGRTDVVWENEIVDGPWTTERDRRLSIESALDRGDHRTALRALAAGRNPLRDNPADSLNSAIALRHAGQTRQARDAAIAASVTFDRLDSFPAWATQLVGADLDILQGRGGDAIATIDPVLDGLPKSLRERATMLAARARLQRDPHLIPATEPLAFAPIGTGVLHDVRDAIRTGILSGDGDSLRRGIDLADQHALPIEAGEARLWLSQLQSHGERSATITLCRAGLQRCGVRAWDQRLDLLAHGSPAPARDRRADPGLDALSQAEFRVAEAVASGLTNREVAAKLIISVKTVDFHLQQMYRKLGIRSRTELAVRMTNFEPRRQENDHD